MKAAVATEQGLAVRDIAQPKPKPNEVLVRVRAAALNRADLWDAVTVGKLKLPIDRRFPLDEAVAAQAHMRENKHFGKIVLTM